MSMRQLADAFRGNRPGIMPDTPVVLRPPEPSEPVAFPSEALPETVRAYVEAAGESLSVPLDYIAVPALGVMGAAIGTTRFLSPKDGWTEYPSLYVGVVGPSGAGKSPALRAAIEPVYRQQAHFHDLWKVELAGWEMRPEDDRGPRPEMASVVTTDATVEAVARMLQSSPRGLLMHKDELTGWVAAFDAYRSGRGADREFWLSVHSHQPVKVDRKTGDPVYLPRPFVAVIGGFTPARLDRFITKDADPDGFWERILAVFPKPLVHAVSRAGVPAKLMEDYCNLVARLYGLQPLASEHGSVSAASLTMEDDAAEAWWAWAAGFAHEHATDAKAAKWIAASLRLGVILHEAWRETDLPRPVSAETIRRAQSLVSYFVSHEAKIRHVAALTDEDRRDRLAFAWLERQVPDEAGARRAKARDLQRAEVAGVKKADEARSVMQSLLDRGWVRGDVNEILLPSALEDPRTRQRPADA